jgi:predicted nucleotidyltransferase
LVKTATSDDELYLHHAATLIKFFSHHYKKLSKLTMSQFIQNQVHSLKQWFFVTGTALVIAMRYVAG